MSDKVTYINELVKKPSDAISALEDGIKNHYEYGIDDIEMAHFLQVEKVEKDRKCFGCAATMSILSILNIKRNMVQDAIKVIPGNYIWESRDGDHVIGTPLNRTAFYMKCKDGLVLDKYDIDMFEGAMDDFRKGHYESLLAFYELYDEYEGCASNLISVRNWYLENDAVSDEPAWDGIKEYKDQLITLGY